MSANPFRAVSDYNAKHLNDCSFMGKGEKGPETWLLRGGKLTVQAGFKRFHYNLTDCEVELVDGGERQRMTVTRIGAGALLAGPVGALIGGMAKKDLSKTFALMSTPDGVRRLEATGKEAQKAREFMFKFEAEFKRQSQSPEQE